MKLALLATTLVAAAVAAATTGTSTGTGADLAVRDPHTALANTLDSHHDARDFARKDLHKRKRIVHKNSKVTFYWGSQLNNPACGGPTPSEWEPVAAVKLSKGFAKCGDELHVHWKGKMVSVRVVDDCGSCTEDRLWVDLPRGVFSRLENLDVGVLNNAHIRVIHK